MTLSGRGVEAARAAFLKDLYDADVKEVPLLLITLEPYEAAITAYLKEVGEQKRSQEA